MPDEMIHVAQQLLALKAKAHHGVDWTEQEESAIKKCLEGNEWARILAACCVLSSQRPKGCPVALAIVRDAVQRKSWSAYVETLIIEAVIFIDPKHLESISNAILPFLDQSLSHRAVNPVNTVTVLGNLARLGKKRALELLKQLAEGADMDTRNNAALVLRLIHKGGNS